MKSPGLTPTGRLTIAFSLALLLSACASTSPPKDAEACPGKIQNFCEVSPGVLWRGAKPDEAGAAWLIEKGVRTVVNLEFLHDDLPVFSQAKVDAASRYEVAYFRVRDWEPLALLPMIEDDHVAHFLAIVHQQARPVYVHCRTGQNRTGLMVAAYRVMLEGVSLDDAILEMGRYQGFWFKADERYIRGLTPERREAILRKMRAWLPRLEKQARIVCESGSCAILDR